MRTHNLFISHSWAYGDHYDRLMRLLRAAPRFEFRDYSVPKNDPIHNAPNAAALQDAIKRQMQWANVVILLGGVYATYSKWINIEISLAKRGFTSSKAIVGIKPYASTVISSVVRENADRICNWSTSSVVAAIREARDMHPYA